MQHETEPTAAAGRRINFVILLPLALFVLVAAFFVKGLMNEKGANYIPSTLIGKPVPDFALAPMEGLTSAEGGAMPTFDSQMLKNGKVSVINVWSSWCASCRFEHKFLEQLVQKSGVALYGLNYKDTTGDGRDFLAKYGNPYVAVGMDPKGKVGIDFGVYGVPETFVVDGKGIIRYKLPGPVNAAIIEKDLLPAIEKARQVAAGSVPAS